MRVEGGVATRLLHVDGCPVLTRAWEPGRAREGTGGMQPLGRDDKASIETTIDDEVLKGQAISFAPLPWRRPPAGG